MSMIITVLPDNQGLFITKYLKELLVKEKKKYDLYL